MPIYKNQTAAKLIVKTGIDFTKTAVLNLKIYYEKPDGVKGYWDAYKLVGGELQGKLYVIFSDTIKFDVAGTWKLWVNLHFSDGRTAQGDVATYKVYEDQKIT